LSVLKIGLTGGIGCGKSAAARLFVGLGVPVFDADEIVRELVAPGQPALAAIAQEFGEGVCDGDGRLDRAALRARVFADAAAKRALEAILHPLVYETLDARAECLAAPYCVFAIPLLIETGRQAFVDRILLVDCAVGQQYERVRRRDGLDDASIGRILAAQASREEKRAAAHDIIDNTGPVEQLRGQVEALHRTYLALALDSR
jgi:dephospho-CoA kinase